MNENAQILLRMMTEFHRQVQDSLGERGKPALLLGNPVVRTFNAYLNQMREMFPDSFIAQLPPVESVPEFGETELAPVELEKLHLSKAHEVSMACSQIIEYLSGILNGEVGFSKTTRRLPEILAVLDTLRQEIQGFKLTDGEEDRKITEMLLGKYNDCLSVCHETVGEGDTILPRLFKPIEFPGNELSCAMKIQEVKISSNGLHAYLEALEQQEAALKKQQSVPLHGITIELSRIRDWMDTRDRRIRSEFEDVRQKAEETKEQAFEKTDEQIENVEVQFEERVQHLEERLDEMKEKIDELKDRCNEMIDERVSELDERVEHLEENLSERIEGLEEKHNNALENLQEGLRENIEGLEEKAGELEERTEKIDELEGQLEEAHRKIEEFEERFSHLDEQYSERVDGLNERLEEINQRLDETNESMEGNIDDKIHHLEEQLGKEINKRVEELKEKRRMSLRNE